MARPLTTREASAGLARYEAKQAKKAKAADAARLVDALLTDIVDNGAYNALGTGIVERLLEIKAAL